MQISNILRIALFETRRSHGRLAFSVFAIAIGVGAVTAVRTAVLSLDRSVARQARSIMGADLVLQSNQPLESGAGLEMRRELEQTGAKSAGLTEFYSMLIQGDANAGQSDLVRVRGVESPYPFYGRIPTNPPGGWEQLTRNEGPGPPPILVDPALREVFELTAGSQVRLGNTRYTVIGEIVKEPGSPAAGMGMAPMVYVPRNSLPGTGLMQTGSRIRHQVFFAVPENFALEEWKQSHFEAATENYITIQTYREAADNVQRFLLRLSHFLTMSGLITLLLSGLGIGSALHVFLKDKLDHAAVLRSLGARPRDVLWIYGALALVLGMIGSAIGLIPGIGLPFALSQITESPVVRDLLPIRLELEFSLRACLEGVFSGTLATLVFTLIPVLRIRNVSPMRVLRHDFEEGDLGSASRPGTGWRARLRGLPDTADLIIYLIAGSAMAAFLILLTATQTESIEIGLWFTLSILGAVVALIILARAARWMVRLCLPYVGSYRARQGLANLYRPGNQTTAVMVSIGMGVLLLTTIYILRSSIQAAIAVEDREDLPNMFIVNIQPEERTAVAERISQAGGTDAEFAPMISARVESINGRPVDRQDVERDAVQQTWNDRVRTREYFVSYRDHLIDSEELVEGDFWTERPSEQELSVDEQWAEMMEVETGDMVRLNVQGLPLDARVTSLRRIRWVAMRPNAILLLSPGLIESAPGMIVVSFRHPGDEADQARFRYALARDFPAVTVIAVGEAVASARLIMSRISLVIEFLAFLTLINGLIILVGSIAAGRFARLREAMLLKVLGANRRDLRNILGVEYAALAFLGALAGWILGELINRPLLQTLFATEVVVPYAIVLALVVGVVVLNTLLGLFVSRDVSRARPMDILREE